MTTITLAFPSLNDLAECMFSLGLRRPVIDYDQRSFTAQLTPEQIEVAKKFRGTVVSKAYSSKPMS
ncbi:MAG: hypothetical protein EOO16_16015 [Chitinophagaceae bacterium]|nr:MAG: hypothetical protein EOO16_16015 [Chitinophagaceae bacterium]